MNLKWTKLISFGQYKVNYYDINLPQKNFILNCINIKVYDIKPN